MSKRREQNFYQEEIEQVPSLKEEFEHKDKRRKRREWKRKNKNEKRKSKWK